MNSKSDISKRIQVTQYANISYSCELVIALSECHECRTGYTKSAGHQPLLICACSTASECDNATQLCERNQKHELKNMLDMQTACKQKSWQPMKYTVRQMGKKP